VFDSSVHVDSFVNEVNELYIAEHALASATLHVQCTVKLYMYCTGIAKASVIGVHLIENLPRIFIAHLK